MIQLVFMGIFLINGKESKKYLVEVAPTFQDYEDYPVATLIKENNTDSGSDYSQLNPGISSKI